VGTPGLSPESKKGHILTLNLAQNTNCGKSRPMIPYGIELEYWSAGCAGMGTVGLVFLPPASDA
jgi:hypothetical protein